MNLSSVDLNLLFTLHVLLEEGSVASAAGRLHVTPPAISNALARLREVLGDPLFVRRGRGLVATPRALELAPSLERVFAELGRTLSRPFDARTSTRMFTLALSDADQVGLLPAIARRFAHELPSARLSIVTLDTLTSSGGLAGSVVDATLGPVFEGEGLHRKKLFTDEGVFVARRGHPRVVKGKLTRALFDGEQHVDVHVLLGQPGTGHRLADEAFTRAGLRRTVAVTVPSFAAVASVVSSTNLLGGMPRRIAEFYARALPLRILSSGMPPLRMDMNLLWHERTHRDPAQIAFRTVVVAAAAEGPEAPVAGTSRLKRG